MSLLKRGVLINVHEADTPMTREDIPLVVMNLSPHGLRLAAAVGLNVLQGWGYSLNQALAVLGGTPKERK